MQGEARRGEARQSEVGRKQFEETEQAPEPESHVVGMLELSEQEFFNYS